LLQDDISPYCLSLPFCNIASFMCSGFAGGFVSFADVKRKQGSYAAPCTDHAGSLVAAAWSASPEKRPADDS
jgi:hypothetical protein